MKQLIMLLIATAFLAASAAFADEFTFEWDYPSDQAIDGFRLYSGHMGQDEVGNWLPQYDAAPLVDAIPADARTVTATQTGWDNVSKKFCFMVRSYKGTVESADSNFVCATIDNTPLSAPEITTGIYDAQAGLVALTWTSAADERLKYFRIFYRAEDEDIFHDAGKVARPETMPVTVQSAIDAVGPGELKTLYFVVVGYKDEGVYSPNSAEFAIVIDRTNHELPTPTDFRFSALIPVE